MIDLRPVGYIIGLLITTLAAVMLIPMVVDLSRDDPHWFAFLESAIITGAAGGFLALACRSDKRQALTLHQSFVLTSGIWLMVPLFGTLPLMLGAPGLGFTDAYFEAMSGVTTTGATVIVGLDDLPLGANLWRGLMQWLGGLGIVIVAMIFLPIMKVGGMQFFRSEGFDTLGKILPRAMDISSALIRVYLALTIACASAYALLGLSPFDAVMHTLSTVSTGGFSSYDASFGALPDGAEVVASVFMILASLPFIRYVQLAQGQGSPIFRDVQVRAFIRWIAYAVAALVAYRLIRDDLPFWPVLRETAFNVISVMTGTGFASGDVTTWGHMALVVLVLMGLIGGCSSSTVCSIKVFRWLILLGAIRAQIRRLHSPHRVQPVRLDGRVVDEDVISSVMAFFTLFMVTFGVLIVALSLTGLSSQTAITAAWTSIANVGPAWGPEVSATGAMDGFPAAAKWVMILGMFLGRLELLSVFVLLMPRFWRG
ncbi:potassium transporter TrkH [Frigidibacter albus]|uniref:Trk system potassium uptake protein n=1 Tax=Frigidibacter albus TaxID=1465486 RepID=A0A6L8VL06_9RHOB|nr:TrkH family potassium uptake protein [Frigidibacter albus]MZQ90059.1 potassium transporter TrkH [Frigidibacter albus]NBE31967.1 potassium transporter TrkH [Frigidibacter albus]GGH57591.1 Trk system potassium uptake protein [Frigidibacter albus]